MSSTGMGPAELVAAKGDEIGSLTPYCKKHDTVSLSSMGNVVWSYLHFNYASLGLHGGLHFYRPSLDEAGYDTMQAIERRITAIKQRYENEHKK